MADEEKMTITGLIRSQIAEIEGDVPKWMLEALDIGRENDAMITGLKAKLEATNSELQAITEKLREAQKENIAEAESKGQTEVTFGTDEDDGVLDLSEVAERGVEF